MGETGPVKTPSCFEARVEFSRASEGIINKIKKKNIVTTDGF